MSNHATAIIAHDNVEHTINMGVTSAPVTASDQTAVSNIASDAIQSIDGKGNAIDANNSSILNDIGNMLANLTDELDAMLEEEKRAGLNDSE